MATKVRTRVHLKRGQVIDSVAYNIDTESLFALTCETMKATLNKEQYTVEIDTPRGKAFFPGRSINFVEFLVIEPEDEA